MSDITAYKSHPDKLLVEHIKGVVKNVSCRTDSIIAETAAVFHDLGKMNPNFQAKLEGKTPKEYSNHSLLSAYAFYCTVLADKNKSLSTNEIIGIIVLIAKHHGNLPDFCPSGIDAYLLSKNEIKELFSFLKNTDLPFYDYVNYFYQVADFSSFVKDSRVQKCFLERLVFTPKHNDAPLHYFLTMQSAFANLVQADKADAARFESYVKEDKDDVDTFSGIFCRTLDAFLNTLNQNSDLNILRTKIRCEAVKNINDLLPKGKRVFDLTSPTGSGKTLMLLSLAAEIIKQKGSKRIIYALPFLSITEQVEKEVLKIFKVYEQYIQRIDSKSVNSRLDEIQNELDSMPDEEKIEELNALDFRAETFSYPLIVTTFVRFFESLLSNRNSVLQKLPNFSNCVFLLDEIQALPPRLYGFFVAYLSKFCEMFDSYAIISTATQPNFELPDYDGNIKAFFSDYEKPAPLLPLSYFKNDLFNRYAIIYKAEIIDIHSLIEMVIKEDNSVLLILNTIDDTKEAYNLLSDRFDGSLILLNTHFTPYDRKKKIQEAKDKLASNDKVIVISTQLIEAGVDIDFPIVYRDFTTVASIVQSAGRCNRNGKMPQKGRVVLFKLKNNDKIRYELIFNGNDSVWINYTSNAFVEVFYEEKSLLAVQKLFFDQIQSETKFAHYGKNLENDLLKDIQSCMFDKIGHFRLIDEDIFGTERRYYIPKDEFDNSFNVLLAKQKELLELYRCNSDFLLVKAKKKDIETHLKKMSDRIVQVRLKRDQNGPLSVNEPYFDLNEISLNSYSFEKGVALENDEIIL
jgi:CRISPR-associated endonuclease/helicase Cas3